MPAAAVETATPRRRTNQCEMSAISGPKMADEPTPMSTPCTTVNWTIDVVMRGQQEARAERDGGDQRRTPVADPVDGAADDHIAQRKADHGRRIGQRRIGAVDAELRLHRRQHHDDGPHAGAADGGQQHAYRQPQPGVGAVDVGDAVADLCGSRYRGHGSSLIGVRFGPIRAAASAPQANFDRASTRSASGSKTSKKAGLARPFLFIAMPLPTNLSAAACRRILMRPAGSRQPSCRSWCRERLRS